MRTKSAAKRQQERADEINQMGVDEKKNRITKLLEQTPSKIKLKTPATLHKGKEWDDSVSVGALPTEGTASRGRNADGKTNSVRNDPQGRF